MDFFWLNINGHETDAKTINEVKKYLEWKEKVENHKFFKIVMMESFIHDGYFFVPEDEDQYDFICKYITSKKDVEYMSKLFPLYKRAFELCLNNYIKSL